MLFIALCKFKPGEEQAVSDDHMELQYPEGIKLIAEYWPETSDPAIITIFEADSMDTMMTVAEAWQKVFEITVVPAIKADEGVSLLRQIVAR
jgi:hypothetical protein